MRTGSAIVHGDLNAVREKLKLILAGANCRVAWLGGDTVTFRHGTYVTQTLSMLPKAGRLQLAAEGDRVRVHWSVEVATPARIWLILVAVVFFWLIFPPLLVYHALVRHPEQFVRNILAAL